MVQKEDERPEVNGGFRPAEMGDIREELCVYSTRLKQRGLTSSTGGNVSCRVGEDLWISPTGCVMDELEVEDWVRVHLRTGEPYPRQSRPSSELVMHREIYLARPDVFSIFHSHPVHVFALSLLGIEIRPIGSEAPIFLGERIPLVPYEIPTSPLLGEAVARYAKDYNVMTLENHGLVALGKTIRDAYNRTELAEELARVMVLAYSLDKGEPRWPSAKDLQEYRNWYFDKKLPE
jgi:L-fuculose-phosphate aldolase